ncbi:MAG: hypothetical protein L0Y71_08855 [Gemmataceae bacterium]|nr:hypothetical protein [Gemmataceae bacterium]
MTATTIETVIQADGELHLSHLPIRKGDRVEAVISVLAPAANGISEEKRAQARQQFLALARSSTFCSKGAYPTRDALHERH